MAGIYEVLADRAGKPAGRKPEKQGLTGLFTKGKNIPTTAQQTLSLIHI